MHSANRFLTDRGAARAALALLLLLCPALAAGQRDSVTIVPSERYGAGALHQWLLGDSYRDAWETPIRVPVLDLAGFAGGLTPVQRGGGQQTRSLRLRGADGREYNFRSVDKWVTPGPREDLAGTPVEWFVQDQVSSLHPSAVPVATGLLDAVSVLNPAPRLFVMPDDARLGEYRRTFAGLLGTLEIHADETEDGRAFAGAEVESSEDVIDLVLSSAANRIDTGAYLRDRLMSLLLGDWDRHAGQFRWARFDRGGVAWWVPIPEDRDYAFSDYDGRALGVLRAALPKMVTFRDRYPRKLTGLTLNSAEIDRRFLGGVPRSAWRETVASLRADLADAEIAAAVRRMPPAHFALAGEELIRVLRLRRDSLHVVADRFYLQLAMQPEIHGTDERERADVTRLPDGAVRVRLTSAAADSTAGAVLLDRTYLPDETDEILVYLRAGADVAEVTGESEGGIPVRIVGGAGVDTLVDRSVSRAWTAFHDSDEAGAFERGRFTHIDRATYQEPVWIPGEVIPPPDYGRSLTWFEPWVGYEGTQGVIVGGGPSWTSRGFRRFPFAGRVAVRGMLALGSGRAGIDATAQSVEVGSVASSWLHARLSGMEALRFHGYGNDSPDQPAQGDEIVSYQQRLLEMRFAFTPSDELRLSAGPVIEWLDPEAQAAHPQVPSLDRLAYGKVGLAGALRLDTRPERGVLDPGFRIDAEARAFPTAWDVRAPFARFAGTMSGYAGLPGRAILAGRVGAAQVTGDAPLLESVSLGGSETVRGYPFQRFTGDALLFSGVEARVKAMRVKLLVNADLGALAFADAGRVYVDGASEGGWHGGYGAGLWLGSLGRAVSLTYAVGESRVLYLKLGLPY